MVTALQPVSWQRMSDAVAKVRERLLRAARVLDEAGVPYAVVGGNAVAAWVSRVDESAVRNTRDVDLLLRREDLAPATAALEKAGFVHRRLASIGKTGHMDVFLDGADAKVRDALHIVFASEKVLPDSISANADVTESEDSGDFRLIQLEALVRMKLTAWRDKDRVHLRDLADVGLIDESWPERYSGELAQRLQAVLDSPEG
ncbi:MAG: hypothetical protein B7Z47_05955 [Chthoniobacter sp. 12-60-6]|nr:MAG: hypothetical protein B7Z47_05955 [Chthoniobacter sp. 12-60-6]